MVRTYAPIYYQKAFFVEVFFLDGVAWYSFDGWIKTYKYPCGLSRAWLKDCLCNPGPPPPELLFLVLRLSWTLPPH